MKIIEKESLRLKTLGQCDLLDTHNIAELNDITSFAARILNVCENHLF
jgi:hypothetical protein